MGRRSPAPLLNSGGDEGDPLTNQCCRGCLETVVETHSVTWRCCLGCGNCRQELPEERSDREAKQMPEDIPARGKTFDGDVDAGEKEPYWRCPCRRGGPRCSVIILRTQPACVMCLASHGADCSASETGKTGAAKKRPSAQRAAEIAERQSNHQEKKRSAMRSSSRPLRFRRLCRRQEVLYFAGEF